MCNYTYSLSLLVTLGKIYDRLCFMSPLCLSSLFLKFSSGRTRPKISYLLISDLSIPPYRKIHLSSFVNVFIHFFWDYPSPQYLLQYNYGIIEDPHDCTFEGYRGILSFRVPVLIL